MKNKSFVFTLIILLVLLSSCTIGERQFLEMHAREISDGAHQGNLHFFFMPPMVAQPAICGEFCPNLSPVVEIERNGGLVARFSVTEGIGSEIVRCIPEEQVYIVNWKTSLSNLSYGEVYRIHVFVNNHELGFADVFVVQSGNQLKNVDTGEYIPLKDDRTLPIKFRIEKGYIAPTISGWERVAGHNPACAYMAAVPYSNAILAFGGDKMSGLLTSIRQYNAAINSWSSWNVTFPGPYPSLGVDNLAHAIVNGDIYLIAGEVQGIGPVPYLWAYNPATGTLIRKHDQDTALWGRRAASVRGKIFVFGGVDSSGSEQNRVDVYDPSTDSWTGATPMPGGGRALFGCTSVGDKVFVFGGYADRFSRYLDSVLVYDTLRDSWTSCATAMPQARAGFESLSFGDKILLVAGDASRNVPANTVYYYDPANDSYTRNAVDFTIAPEGRRLAGMAVLEDRVYIISGYYSDSNGQSEEVFRSIP
jgi:N-acetylneuraminic acid mutarotase